jgi:hypothetical protein
MVGHSEHLVEKEQAAIERMERDASRDPDAP